MVYINKSHLTDRGVFLPVEIKRKLLGDDKDNKCLLMLKNDGKLKAWEVVAEGGYLGNAKWLKFVEDNGVKVGDICVLEPIHRDKNILGVTIFKSSF
ncbi:hypothetical protein M8C21_023013 [Ambrosia artemisiifolia]|uniref:TF-B3 domain-containing protein n=1 Tax=Ambrosia artemisiifolia TaxID=4212 RepID=A0AAD5GIC1_AMBAR|nr:hypothetical protein M8C21_023013 [Ambrosia artemisiifolia]